MRSDSSHSGDTMCVAPGNQPTVLPLQCGAYLPAHPDNDEDSMTHRPLSSAPIPAALAGLALLGGLVGRRTPTS